MHHDRYNMRICVCLPREGCLLVMCVWMWEMLAMAHGLETWCLSLSSVSGLSGASLKGGERRPARLAPSPIHGRLDMWYLGVEPSKTGQWISNGSKLGCRSASLAVAGSVHRAGWLAVARSTMDGASGSGSAS